MADHPEANFDLATTLPGLVMGPNLFQTSSQEISGSNAILWNILTNGLPYPFWQTNVHVQDIAHAHVAAVDKDKVASGRYLLNGSNEPWSYALEYVKKRWPERTWAEKETIGLPFEWDSSKARREMGIDWIPFEKQIDDVVEQMIALGA
jgi:nucleoside-diphosphate-sugar epimerase